MLFFFHSADKTKCYEVIKRLSDVYQADKEYSKVCELVLLSAFLLCAHLNLCVYVHVAGEGLAEAH